MTDKQQQIQNFLNDIESKYQINIILAVESGSRAWGFPSKDSDYDIRLIYHHPKDWYLSAFKKRNVIENIFEGDLDAAGWDVTKCLQLFYKSNAPLYEWLHSPIIYRKNQEKLSILKRLALQAFNPKMVFYHYISLAKKKLLDDKTKSSSKYFLYALRALFCAQWVSDEKAVPPVEFDRLVSRYVMNGMLKNQITDFLNIKSALSENDEGLVSNELLMFANDLFETLEKETISGKSLKTMHSYDEVLLEIIKD